jgi:hypothetical protein
MARDRTAWAQDRTIPRNQFQAHAAISYWTSNTCLTGLGPTHDIPPTGTLKKYTELRST